MKPAIKGRLLVYAVVMIGVLAWMQWRTREPAPIEVVVVREGTVNVDGQVLELASLGPYVARQLDRDPRRRVLVSVDARAPSTVLIPVLDALDRSGVDNVQVVANP